MGFLLLSSMSVQAEAPRALTRPAFSVTLTAYNAVPAQTDESPLETASGAFSNPEVVAARSQDLAKGLPFGTIIEFSGPAEPGKSCGYGVVAPKIGYRVIADAMNARFTDRVDILFDTKKEYKSADSGMKNAAQVLGICEGASVRVVGFVSVSRIPKTQAELAMLVGAPAKGIALR